MRLEIAFGNERIVQLRNATLWFGRTRYRLVRSVNFLIEFHLNGADDLKANT